MTEPCGEPCTDVKPNGEPPLLVVEIRSPSTALVDLNRKKAAYERFGVPLYWIVDPDPPQPELTVFELGDGRYAVTGGIKAGVERARAVADGKPVLLAGGVSIAQQALAAELVDEVVLHVVPKLVGRGVRLFGPARWICVTSRTSMARGAVHLRHETA